jgi:ParB-like chromosome segregation protein Spo0J
MSEKKASKPPVSNGSTGAVEKGPEEIREEIEGTREELGDTVAAVAEKTDVKKQAQAKVDDVKAQVSAKADEAKVKAKELGDQAKAAAPESPSEGAQQARALAQRNPTPVAIAGAVLALLVLWRLLRR